MYVKLLQMLDGTYIRVKVDVADMIRYRSRKDDIATNILGICTRNMKFMYVLSVWEGSATDSKVFRYEISKPNGLMILQGKCIVPIYLFFCDNKIRLFFKPNMIINTHAWNYKLLLLM